MSKKIRVAYSDLHRIAGENEMLRLQVTALQSTGTELVLERQALKAKLRDAETEMKRLREAERDRGVITGQAAEEFLAEMARVDAGTDGDTGRRAFLEECRQIAQRGKDDARHLREHALRLEHLVREALRLGAVPASGWYEQAQAALGPSPHPYTRRMRVRAALDVVDALLREHASEFETDWHGYVGEAAASLRAALGDPMPTDIDRATEANEAKGTGP